MPKHQAPILASELHRALAEWGIGVRNGSGGRTIATIDGTEISVPPPSQRKAEIPDRTVRLFAHALGVSTAEFREAVFGRKAVKGGKPKEAVGDTPNAGPAKSDVLSAVMALRSHVEQIERWLRPGSHSGDLYRRVMGACSEARQLIRLWPPDPATGVESPDDTKYRPAVADPITTGAARVTGLTASAAKRRTTYTKWRHDELGADE